MEKGTDCHTTGGAESDPAWSPRSPGPGSL